MQDSQKLFEALLRAETENEVTQLLAASGLLDDESAWEPLGGIENNFTTVGNQQSDPTGALVEKLINGIDAVLMRECFARKLNPESGGAPQTMAAAVELFFGVRDGRIGNIESNTELTRLAENIRLVAVGSKGQPNYLIVDTGEGQTPDAFPETFCSLNRSNKLRIQFVQGKYNAGGTGVLQFCGEKNYQLIASRRNPVAPVSSGDTSRDLWGFTIIRRVPASEGRRCSMYVYLAPAGTVPRFEAKSIAVLPSGDKGKKANEPPAPYSAELEYGSVVKLFDYRWRARSILTTEGRYELEQYLQSPALPFRVTETRAYSANYYSATVSGVWAGIALPGEGEDETSKVEPGFPAYGDLTMDNVGSLPYQIVVFKDNVNPRHIPTGVCFTVNGQVHGQLPADFVSRRLGFDYLSRYLLVSVDCTNMTPSVREDFFMASRDRIRKNEVYDGISTRLTQDLREHEGLRELNAVRRNKQIEAALANDKEAVEVFQQLLKADPTLAMLLSAGDRLVTKTGAGPAPEYKGKKFPTYFRLKKASKEGLAKVCPINRTVRVEFETDAENDYFARSDSPGSITIDPPGVCEHSRLWNGEYTMRFHAPSGPIGTKVRVEVSVTDVTRDAAAPFVSTFDLISGPKDESPSSTASGGKGKQPNNQGSSTAPRVGLPLIQEVRQDQWGKDFDEFSALRIKNDGKGGYDFTVNMDNMFLLTEMSRGRASDKSLVKFWFKYGLALCALGVLQGAKMATPAGVNGNGSHGSNGHSSEGTEDTVDLAQIGRYTDGLARVIVPVIRSLYRGPQALS